MTILQIFNKYQKPGGEEASVLRVAETLEKDHKVVRCYFDSKDWAERGGFIERLRQAMSMLYNPSALRRVRNEIREHQPDLILLHNIFPICSAAMLYELVRGPVPVLQYIHNFRPFSVNGYCWGKDRLLPQGLNKNFFPEILDASWQDSRLRTAWYAMILWALHFTGTFKKIDRWIAISDFMRGKFVDAGIAPSKIDTLRHSWNPCPALRDGCSGGEPPEPYLLFLGRLSSAKGVDTLLEAWRLARPRLKKGKLIIGGEGPMDDTCAAAAAEYEDIEFRGHVSGQEKFELLRGARGVVAPSVWWEPLGIVVYEAYDHSKPVLVAATGGLTETVIDGRTGLLHEPGDAGQLQEHIVRLLEDLHFAKDLGAGGKAHLLRTTNPEDWKSRIEEIIGDVVRSKAANRYGADEGERKPERGGETTVNIYLADQNAKLGRSLGISRMTEVVMEELQTRPEIGLRAVISRSSIRPRKGTDCQILPWSTRSAPMRVFSDHFYPLLNLGRRPDVWYFPKGYLPALHAACSPSVVTIHDTIVQFYADNYPNWRTRFEYRYWAGILKHTLLHADHVLTISQFSKNQIIDFMRQHGIPDKEITVTYEPCLYESIPQPEEPEKGDYALHLASREPHKRTAWIIDFWLRPENGHLPKLRVVGKLQNEVANRATQSSRIVMLPFLDDMNLQAEFRGAKALLFSSEIEGFGLPAIEAYYLGTPVCFVKDTSVEEVLAVATHKGGFWLDSPDSLLLAIEEVLAMPPGEVRQIGLSLREVYSAATVADRMVTVFQQAAGRLEPAKRRPQSEPEAAFHAP